MKIIALKKLIDNADDFLKNSKALSYLDGISIDVTMTKDGYIIPFGNLEQGKKNTIDAIQKAEEKKVPYCTILYHDYQYNEKTYPDEKRWYDWLLGYLKKKNYEFISYEDAILELEEYAENGRRKNSICQ